MVDLNKSLEYGSYLSKTVTGEIVRTLANQGINVSERWVGGLLIFVSLGLILVGIKVTKPIIKWIFIILGILLFIGLILPVW